MLRQFLKDQRGATAVEYGIIVTVLSLSIIAGVGTAMDAVEQQWADTNGDIAVSLN